MSLLMYGCSGFVVDASGCSLLVYELPSLFFVEKFRLSDHVEGVELSYKTWQM